MRARMLSLRQARGGNARSHAARGRVVGLAVPSSLHFVPIDFEADDDWWRSLLDAGFEPSTPAVVSSSGVSMYITKTATATTLQRLAGMAPGSIVAMTFMLPLELVDDADRPGLESARAARRRRGRRGSASTRRRRSRPWPERPASPRSDPSRPPTWPGAFSQAGPTGSNRPVAKRSSSLGREAARAAVLSDGCSESTRNATRSALR